MVMLNVYRHYDDFHTPVIQSGHRNALWEGWESAMCHKAKNLLL